MPDNNSDDAYRRTLYGKIWDRHVVLQEPGLPAILYADLHIKVLLYCSGIVHLPRTLTGRPVGVARIDVICVDIHILALGISSHLASHSHNLR